MAGVAIFTTIVVNIFAPLWQWRLKKSEKQHENRKEMVAYWRTQIPLEDYDGFFNSAVYSTLRPHLSESVRDSVEHKGGTIVINMSSQRNHNDPKARLLVEVSRIEKDVWKLV